MKLNNKKKYIMFGTLIFILTLFVAIIGFTNATASSPYLPSDNPLGEGIHNIYFLVMKDGSSDVESGGLNSITYIDETGNPTSNVFMDTFAINGSSLDNRMIAVNALNDKVQEINDLNNSNIKINIIMALDVLSNDNRVNNFAELTNDMKQRISNQVDDIISYFVDTNGKSKFANLNLIGFYWTPESINIVNSTFSMVEYFNTYVHSKNYKTLWVPYIMGHDRLHDGNHEVTLDDLNYACEKYSEGLNEEACSTSTYSLYKEIDGVRYYKDELYLYGYKYGFDFVSIQSNYVFSDNNPSWNEFRSGSKTNEVSRLMVTDNVALKTKASVEVELDPDSKNNFSLYGNSGCRRYKEWLEYGVSKEWNNSINVYYFYDMFSSKYLGEGRLARSIYEATYKYANGTLTQDDINAISCDRDYYSKYENVALNKQYTSNATNYTNAPNDGKTYGYNLVNENFASVYTEDSSKYCKYGSFSGDKWTSSLYCDDGKKLTDGIFGISTYSKYDDWVAFNLKNDIKPYVMTVDLSFNMKSLSYFGMELNNHNGGGIKVFPRDENGSIKIYVSDDNTNFSYVGELSRVNNVNIGEAAYYELKLENSVSGRYVKFEVNFSGTSGFIFVSEMIVGRTSSIDFSKEKSVIDVGIGDPAVTHSDSVDLILDNVTADNLQVNVETNDDIDANIVNNKLVIDAYSDGTAVVKVKDIRYDTEASLNVEALGRYKITFDKNGGSIGDNVGFMYAAYNYDKFYATMSDVSESTDLVPLASRSGYTFLGWFSAKTNGMKIFNSDGTIVSNCDGYTKDGKWIRTSDVTLYAYFENSTSRYKITFNPNGGSLSGTSPLYAEYNGTNLFANTTDDTVVKAPVATKTGYTFLGWYNSNGDKILNNYGQIMSGNYDGYVYSGVWDIDSDITLYAQYMANAASSYTVTYNCTQNGGYFDGPYDVYTESYKEGSDVDLGHLCVRDDDYNFVGWNTDKNSVDALSNYVMPSKDVVLYGIFKKIIPEDGKIVFDDDINFKINNNVNVLYNINSGFSSTDLLSVASLSKTDGTLSVMDSNNVALTENMKLRTGFKLRAEFSTNTVEYLISIKGDVLGIGDISMDGAKMIGRHVIDKNVIKNWEYLLAADYNNDGEIKMNDVIKMLHDLKGSSE